MISPTAPHDPAAIAASLAHWWALAGVDTAVGEMPHDWLTRVRPVARPAFAVPPTFIPAPPPPMVEAAPISAIAAPAAPMPDDLDTFLHWLATDADQMEAAFSQTRILPHVVPGSAMLLITDMPTGEDMAAGQLFSGADRRLLANMLRAVGVDISGVSMASLLLARPAGGIADDRMMEKAATRLSHLVGLMAPRSVILLGDGTGRAFPPMNGDATDHKTPVINHSGGSISAMHLPAPFVLLKHAERKAAAWSQLRLLAARR